MWRRGALCRQLAVGSAEAERFVWIYTFQLGLSTLKDHSVFCGWLAVCNKIIAVTRRIRVDGVTYCRSAGIRPLLTD